MSASTVTYQSVQAKFAGLGIATVVLAILAGAILQKTRRIRSMPAYFTSTYSFFKDKHPKLPIIVSFLYYLILLTPVILLLVWVILLGVNFGANPALPVLFTGLFMFLIFIPSYSSLFYLKVLAMLICYMAAEMLSLGLSFSSSNINSFWALTCVSLTLNCMFVVVCLWFIDGSTWSIPDNIPSSLKKQIRASVKIWKKQDQPPEIIDGGLYAKFDNLPLSKRAVIISVVYFCGLVILGIFSAIGKTQTNTGYQALVDSLAVVTTDITTFMLIFISKRTGFNPNFNTVVVIAVRVCIIAFSGNYWFMGYCLLFLILFTYISIIIINKYYPTYQKPPTAQVTRTNIFKMPQFAALFLIVMFSCLVYYLGQDGGKTLPVTSVAIGGGVYPFWAVGVCAMLLACSLFFYLISFRIVDRSTQKVRSLSVYYLGCETCGEYYFFIFCSYIFLVILGCYLYSVVGRHIIWASCVFLPLFYQSFVIFYMNWKQNDYLLLGDMSAFNKKIKKKKQRQIKIDKMKSVVVSKMKQQDQEMAVLQSSNLRVMDNAIVQDNMMINNYDLQSNYSEWRQQMNIVSALKQDKLLPTDKRIVLSIPAMLIILVVYSVVFFYSQDRDMTAFTVSVQIIVLFLLFIPIKRYFCTFETLNIWQILMIVVGLVLNYTFGAIAYAFSWNTSPTYTVLWIVFNIFIIATYSALNMVKDKGLSKISVALCVISMILSFGIGIVLLGWFSAVAVGIAFLGAAFFYSYFLTVYLIYVKMNYSVPFLVLPLTGILIVITCFAVMIYGFASPDLNDFYGFSITYLIINFLGLIYASYRIFSDILSRDDKPNFYSTYGSPIYKYDFNLKSAVQNMTPMQLWLAFWFMFYAYSVLMQIFIQDPNYGVSASMIPFTIFSITFVDVVTYNLYRAGTIKNDITQQILTKSWQEVLKTQNRSLGNFLNLEELQQQLQELKERQNKGEQKVRINAVKVNPMQQKIQNDQHQQSMTKFNITNDKNDKNGQEVDITHLMYDLQMKIDKAAQNDKILLVNFWTNIVFKTGSIRKKRMLSYINFIRDCGDILAEAGIALVLNDNLYDYEQVYNQAYQQMQTMSPLQRMFFNKQFKAYQERKQKQQVQKQIANQKESENQIKRAKQLQNRIKNNDKEVYYPNVPVQKLQDGPVKYQKLKQTLKQAIYLDNSFMTNNDIIPSEVRSSVKGWKRPSKDSVVMRNQLNTGFSVRQGMLGNCYLISAIGVMGKDRLRQIITQPSEGPSGAYMVKFRKFNQDIYVIVDDQFPVGETSQENQWIFGRCEDEKQLFCNIIQKAYAKLYGGYTNIIGGKVALALSDMTGGFPEQIQLKPYQQANTNEIFQKMLQFKKAGYLMGAGTPPNPKGDSAIIDGIFQGHAYLIIDVRDLDGNKLIKVRNPHGNQSTQSTLDWSDDSPKWTNRLKGLLGEKMADDGAFWIGLDDFVYCFRALYICRIFDDSWQRLGPFQGEWKGKSAAGLKDTKGTAILQNNPHFGIKVSKACTLFVELTQNTTDLTKPNNKIFFMIQRNSGKRIEAPASSKMVGMSGAAVNSKTISKQINLTADSFPYTFSLMVAIYETGLEGNFSLSFYCNDKNIQVIQDDKFDR